MEATGLSNAVGTTERIAAAGPFVAGALVTLILGPAVEKVLRSKEVAFYKLQVGAAQQPRTLTPDAIADYTAWSIDCYQASTVMILPLIGIAFVGIQLETSMALTVAYVLGAVIGFAIFLRFLSMDDPYVYIRERWFGLYSGLSMLSIGLNVVGAVVAAMLV